MESQRVDKLNTILEELKKSVEKQVAVKLELDLCQRIIQKLSSFSSDCKECHQHFSDFENYIIQILDKKENLTEEDVTQHKQKIGKIRSHLQNKHNLVSSGYYLSIYMSIGTSLGLIFGMLIFDNIGLGLPIGLSIGVAIGAGLDADAKKKGMTL